MKYHFILDVTMINIFVFHITSVNLNLIKYKFNNETIFNKNNQLWPRGHQYDIKYPCMLYKHLYHYEKNWRLIYVC